MLLEARIEEAGYGDKQVLREVELSLAEGERLLIVGSSGSGKTTLLLSVSGVLDNLLEGYTRGKVSLAGLNPLEPEGFRKVPSKAGFVLQDPDKQLAMPTPLDEVMFTLENLGWSEEEARKRALEVLAEMGLKGLELVPVENLSGGQKRRLTLAASLAHNPVILFLDEPTASIDPWGLAELRSYLRRISGERGVAIIEHKARYFLDMVDRVVALREGRIAGYWRPSSPGLVEELEDAGADAGSYTVREPRVSVGEVVVEARGVGAGYGGRVVVEVGEVTVRRGEVVALVGPNGSGKTTLLKTLGGLLKPVEGEVRLRGHAFYMPQHPDYVFLFPTVGREVAEVKTATGVDLTSLPGFEWVKGLMDRSPYRLSHGQRRWLAFGIAIAYRADLYLLDEPTTGMDVGLYRTFGSLLEDLASRSAVLVSTHDVRVVAEYVDRVYMVSSGRVWEVDKGYAVRLLEEAWR
ncbi:MAG: ATP-binding cassette domain-containing protein [Desulfurococcales archaeon]|nr:ATP-binding cassette domain-containing protein [Desulfurococcales archaeon]